MRLLRLILTSSLSLGSLVACSPAPGPSGTDLIKAGGNAIGNLPHLGEETSTTTTIAQPTTTTTVPTPTPTAVPRNERIPIAGGPGKGWQDEDVEVLYYGLRDSGSTQDEAGCMTIVLAWHLTPYEVRSYSYLPQATKDQVVGHMKWRCGL